MKNKEICDKCKKYKVTKEVVIKLKTKPKTKTFNICKQCLIKLEEK